MKCVIHIGMEKTGTTAVQELLSRNAAVLKQNGWHHPDWLHRSQHVKLAMYCQEDGRHIEAKKPFGFDTLEGICLLREQFEHEFNEASKRKENIVLSSEWMHSRVILPSEVARLESLISRYGYEPVIVVYLRRQDKLMNSLFSTAVKNGQSSWEKWRAAQSSSYYDPERLLNLYAGVFGRKSVVARIYDRGSLLENTIEGDFCGHSGLPSLDYSANLTSINPSLSREALLYLMLFNKHVPARVDGRINPNRFGLIDRLLAAFPGNMSVITRAEAKEFYKDFAIQNESVRSKWFPERETLFSESFDNYPETVDLKTFSAEEAVIISSELYSAQAKIITQLKRSEL